MSPTLSKADLTPQEREALAQEIRRLYAESNPKSQAAVADLLGVSQSTVNNGMAGRGGAHLARKLEVATGIRLADLVARKEADVPEAPAHVWRHQTLATVVARIHDLLAPGTIDDVYLMDAEEEADLSSIEWLDEVVRLDGSNRRRKFRQGPPPK